MMLISNDFGEFLRIVRRRRGLSQKDLAKKIGVAPATLGVVETGKRKPGGELLEKLCSMLGLTLEVRHSKDLKYVVNDDGEEC